MPVVVDDAAQVVIGQARVLAAKKLDMPQIPVVEIKHSSRRQALWLLWTGSLSFEMTQ
jgi:ParB-like chromosome segregation protein Spo0J